MFIVLLKFPIFGRVLQICIFPGTCSIEKYFELQCTMVHSEVKTLGVMAMKGLKCFGFMFSSPISDWRRGLSDSVQKSDEQEEEREMFLWS